MNNLTFNFQDHPIRFVGTAENPEWVAADVCKALGLKSTPSDLTRKFNSLEKGLLAIHTPGGKQRLITLKEPGLYKFIFKSETATALEFQNWLAHEVLPAIRKQGYYSNAEAPNPKQLGLDPWDLTDEQAGQVFAMAFPGLSCEEAEDTQPPTLTEIAESIELVMSQAKLGCKLVALVTAEAIAQAYPELSETMTITRKYLERE